MQQDREGMQTGSYAHAYPLPTPPPQAGEGAGPSSRLVLIPLHTKGTNSLYERHQLFRARCATATARDRPKSDISDFGWRVREGACNKIERACKQVHMRTLTPPPPLPRKRGREQDRGRGSY